jgi:hypothetical protein
MNENGPDQIDFLNQHLDAMIAENKELKQRVAELEAELDKCTDVLGKFDFTSGCNGMLCVSGHLKTLASIIASLEAAGGDGTMSRFYCVHCQQNIHTTKVKTRRVFPTAPPPWATFEFMEVPICPLCEGELLDTTAPKRKDETCDTK